jgi:hypothetical protein
VVVDDRLELDDDLAVVGDREFRTIVVDDAEVDDRAVIL